MVLKETDCNNYIVLIEKYLETTWFDALVVETSKRRIILCYRIQWVQPKITSYNTCLHLKCQISVTNGVFSTPGFPQLLKNHWNSDLFQDHGKIIEFHEMILKFVKMKKSWKNHGILDQLLMEKSLNSYMDHLLIPVITLHLSIVAKKHSIATITKLRSLELLIKTPLLHILYYISGLTHDFWTRTGGWEFDHSHGAGTSSPSHWQQVEEQAPKPVGWMMCFLLMTLVPVQKLCVNIYVYIYVCTFLIRVLL